MHIESNNNENKENKIINAYKLFTLKKSVVSNPNIIFIYFRKD